MPRWDVFRCMISCQDSSLMPFFCTLSLTMSLSGCWNSRSTTVCCFAIPTAWPIGLQSDRRNDQ
jgi:hypothetical protein